MMPDKRPGLHTIVRAPGLIATFFPLVIGTAAAVIITGEFRPMGAFFAALVGISLHLSMNVYNDIYDTRQGSDTLESSECFFSGGSGVLITNPELESMMFRIARSGMIVGLLGTMGLVLISETKFWPIFVLVFLIAAFLSKYYTAAPVALSYRGMGEVAVFIAFGPLAILLAAASQGIVWEPLLLIMMPITGIVTLIVTLNGQIVDLPFDIKANKTGLVILIGLRRALHLSAILCLVLVANLLLVAYLLPNGYSLILFMIPFVITLIMAFRYLYGDLDRSDILKKGTGLLFTSMVLCAISIMAGFIFVLLS